MTDLIGPLLSLLIIQLSARPLPGLLRGQCSTTRNLALERSGTGTRYKLFIDGDWFIDGAEQLRFYLEKNVAPYKRMMAESPTGCQPCRPCYNGGDATDGMTCR